MIHVAIVGCGQLARMMALAGWPMGIRFSFIATPEESTRCVEGLGRVVRNTSELSPQAIWEALDRPDVITVERETVDTEWLEELSAYCHVYPNHRVIHLTQHRLRERELISSLGIPVAPWRALHPYEPINPLIEQIGGLPVVIKSAENGYDGRNQWIIRQPKEIHSFLRNWKNRCSCLIEKLVPFEREISLIGAQDQAGNIALYAPSENVHQNGILISSVAPATDLPASIQQLAESYLRTLLKQTHYVGVLAMECFVVEDNLLINELAPRVHNSGHWTMDGCFTSQFENHIRAISGLPLGDTTLRGYAGMINLLGNHLETTAETLTTPQTRFHWYNKTHKPGRKLGHINVLSSDQKKLYQTMQAVQRSLEPALQTDTA